MPSECFLESFNRLVDPVRAPLIAVTEFQGTVPEMPDGQEKKTSKDKGVEML